MYWQPSTLLSLGAVAGTAAAAAFGDYHHGHGHPGRGGSQCRNIPGDADWPTTAEWSKLNSTVSGRLIANEPTLVANVCHGDAYNATACGILQQTWYLPGTNVLTPADIDSPLFQNGSCDPYTPQSQPCTLGNYASYSINVSGADDVIAGLAFAQQKNIRIVIKNSGHDFTGKSTGKGALSLWTYNLKDSEIITNFKSKAYSGPAIRIGAGMSGAEADVASHAAGYHIVAGDCPTVGVAGGYAQGGGHSPLLSNYGMGADQVLEWDVVTPTGDHITVSPDQNSDLYWAISGGGGGTFGVVLSMTYKMYPDTIVGGASLSFNSSVTSLDNLWAAVDAFHAAVPAFVDTGATFLYLISNTSFTLATATSPGDTGEQVQAKLAPFTSFLDKTGIPYDLVPTTFNSYFDHASHYFGPFPYGYFPSSQLASSRLVQRPTITNPDSNAALGKALRTITQSGDFSLTLLAFNGSLANPDVSANSISPAWRGGNVQMLITGEWDFTIPRSAMLEREDVLTNTVVPLIESVTPNSGTYLNEANYRQPNWQYTLYNINYPRLLSIKRKYDPLSLLYGLTSVGSEAWVSDAEGRLCRA